VRYLLVSDVHANFPAFQAVFNDAPDYDVIWCLGDIVGYGPNPNECIERIKEEPHLCVVGNHDWGALGRSDLFVFNRDAREALLWTQGELLSDNRAFLADLSKTVNFEDYLLAHGSPREPIWEYLLDAQRAKDSFLATEFQIAFVGHTHLPLVFEWIEASRDARLLIPSLGEPLQLAERRLIINPGSVGQPRDGDSRAAYGLLDTEAQTFTFHRISYPIEITQARMRARGLPQRLIDRLEVGH
jgi:diadenosine tetraphosphatase ApaH/serine/threonine PP2A family protein phosphatase